MKTQHSFNRPHHESRPGRQRSQGIVLVVALILLIVITISSVVAMRSAQSNDMVSANLRAQTLAQQAAEMALRWCEQRVTADKTTINWFSLSNPAIDNEWQIAERWTNANIVNTVPAATLGAAAPGNGLVNYETPPQCIIRLLNYEELYTNVTLLATSTKLEYRGLKPEYAFGWRITARGYSPDYQRNAAGQAISGSEVWVQSTIRTVL